MLRIQGHSIELFKTPQASSLSPVKRPGRTLPSRRSQGAAPRAGDLASDQRHKARAWLTCDVPLPPRLGGLSLVGLAILNSGTPYATMCPPHTRPAMTNP